MRIAGTFQVVNGQNVIQGRPEDQPNAPLGVYPVNAGDNHHPGHLRQDRARGRSWRREPDAAAVEQGVVLAAPARRRRLLQTSAVATIARDAALVRHQSQPRRLCAVACRVVFIAEC